jgi:hypothetical protein
MRNAVWLLPLSAAGCGTATDPVAVPRAPVAPAGAEPGDLVRGARREEPAR